MPSPSYYGKYRAQVVDVNDPEMRGRVRVLCPKVLGEAKSSWCETCVPVAGDNDGDFWLPTVGETVWIEFEDGNPNKPILSGSWYSKQKSPIGTNYGTASATRIISYKGSKIIMTAAGITATNSDSTVSIAPGTVTISTDGFQPEGTPPPAPISKVKASIAKDLITLSVDEEKTKVSVGKEETFISTDEDKTKVSVKPNEITLSVDEDNTKVLVKNDEISFDFNGGNCIGSVKDNSIELNCASGVVSISMSNSDVTITANGQSLVLNSSNIQKLNDLM